MDKKSTPRYDDLRHIDSTAIDHKPKRDKEDYTADYLKPQKKK